MEIVHPFIEEVGRLSFGSRRKEEQDLIYAFKSVNFLVHLEISVYVQVASQCLAESTLWVDDEQPALYRKGQCPADMPGV
jgi:hypothetical protein